MKVCIITGSAGLIGSEAVEFFSDYFDKIIGIDNNQRSEFFGAEASTVWRAAELVQNVDNYIHQVIDICDYKAVIEVFEKYGKDIDLVIHTAAQPSHDWAANFPHVDFNVNAGGTLNLLEATRMFCPEAKFIFTSTNKVYGDMINKLQFNELNKRYEPKIFEGLNRIVSVNGINENFTIDQSKHSLFGVSKLAADLMVQEYGKYFDMNTVVFRGGCLTGPNHAGAKQHGFLSYLMKCTIDGTTYNINGYKGKQVRDNIHAFDLVNAFYHYYKNPRKGEVYNIGGGRHSNCSVLEAIVLCETISEKPLKATYTNIPRSGDHKWWISDVSKFKAHYPDWDYQFNLNDIMSQLYEKLSTNK